MASRESIPGPLDGPPTVPTWVKVMLIVGLVLLLALAILLLTTSGHGPGRHGP